MVSEKLIIVLITLAILMSITSIVVTVASINSTKIPEIQNRNIRETIIPDVESGRVSLVIVKPATIVNTPTEVPVAPTTP